METGVTPVLFYDPLERVICTIHPNHTYEKVVFDPWKQETWDVNDTLYPTYNPVFEEFVSGAKSYHNPADDVDVGHYIRVLQDEDYLPTWFEQRVNASISASIWPGPENEASRKVEQEAAKKALKHAATPATAYLDSLGRPFLTVANNGKDQNQEWQFFETRIVLDIEGNDLKIYDPRNKLNDPNRPAGQNPVAAFTHRFDIAGRKIYVNSVDSGRSGLLPDVAGNPIRTQDANGNWTSIVYDELRRPTETIVHRTTPYNDTITSQVMIYGESLKEETAIEQNQRGQVYAVFDGAGAVFNYAYDFKGNLEQSIRRLTIKYKTDEIDWKDISHINFTKPLSELEPELEPLLAKETFFTPTRYDALNRVTKSTAPDHCLFTPGGAEPKDGSIYTYGYNEANLLETVTVNLKQKDGTRDDQVFVCNINYNARGQREKIVYGNGVETTYTYDPQTFRLTKLKSNKSDGTKVQELSYIYDPVGNITQIHDGVFKSVFNRNNEIKPENCYTYDPMYRLIEATGREHQAMTACHYKEKDKKQSEFIGLTNQPLNNGQAIGKYTEKYEYDPSGNITLIDHINYTYNKHWKRYQEYARDSNRILSSGAKDQKYDAAFTEIISEVPACENEDDIPHDLNGNISKLPHLPQIIWDEKNQLVQVQLNVDGNPNMAYYQYDAAGQRVRKTVIKGNTVEERIYLGGYEIYTKKNGSGTPLRRDTLHVMDDKDRIALIEKEVNLGDGKITDIRFRYQLSNHLRSSVMEVDETDSANLISYEEYYPYGGTSYIAGISEAEVSKKRYRYSGKERDDETGLYYYGARYYAPWMGRWLSCDPIGLVEGPNMYKFASCNPTRNIDKNGAQAVTTQAEEDALMCSVDLHIVNASMPQIDTNGTLPSSTQAEEDALMSYGDLHTVNAGRDAAVQTVGLETAELVPNEVAGYTSTEAIAELGDPADAGFSSVQQQTGNPPTLKKRETYVQEINHQTDPPIILDVDFSLGAGANVCRGPVCARRWTMYTFGSERTELKAELNLKTPLRCKLRKVQAKENESVDTYLFTAVETPGPLRVGIGKNWPSQSEGTGDPLLDIVENTQLRLSAETPFGTVATRHWWGETTLLYEFAPELGPYVTARIHVKTDITGAAAQIAKAKVEEIFWYQSRGWLW